MMNRKLKSAVLLASSILSLILSRQLLAQEEPLPDLTVTSVTAPASASTQQAVTASWTVTNQGQGIAVSSIPANGGNSDRIYLSADQTLDDSDTYLAEYFRPQLGPGETYTATVSFTPPSLPAGTYYLLVKTDPENRVTETDEANNISSAYSINVSVPDLLIAQVTAPASASTQQGITASWTVTNQGQGVAISSHPASGGNSDRIYFSTDQILDGSDTFLAQYFRPELAPGQSYTATVNFTLPNLPPGTYYLLVKTDPDNKVFEDDESNNTSTAYAISLTVPDLTIISIAVPASVSTQQAATASWTVTNQGQGIAISSIPANGGNSDRLYFSTDQTLDGSDTFLAQYFRPQLGPGESYTATVSFALPNLPPGTYYLLVKTDPENLAFETDETNNISSAYAINLTVPDLIVTSIATPGPASTQQTTTASWTVINQGQGIAISSVPANGDNSDRIYFSADQTLDASDAFLAEYFRPQLGPGESYTATVTFTPPSLPPGTYYLLVKTDPKNFAFETDESNNIFAYSIPLTVPDLTVTQLIAPATARVREDFQVSWVIQNQGNGAAIGTQNWAQVDELYLSRDTALDSTDISIATIWRPPLAPGQVHTATVNINLTNADGTYYLLAVTDRSNSVYESREVNNVFSRLITFGAVGPIVDPLVGYEKDFSVDLISQVIALTDVAVAGDLSGTLSFTNLEMVSITTGSSTGKGFLKGEWTTTLDGFSYPGEFEGVFYLSTKERKIFLKGSLSGVEVQGTVEGYLSESAPDSGVYDQYHATWKLGHLGDRDASLVLTQEGVLSYGVPQHYPGVQMHLRQMEAHGTTLGHYSENIGVILTHLEISSQGNPYVGEGFSTMSYFSGNNSGHGWTYDRTTAPGSIELVGMLDGPLQGIVYGSIDETTAPPVLTLSIARMDLGLPPTSEPHVKIWGPERVSPGQKVDYIIECRNDGIKASEEILLFTALADSARYISASEGAFNNDILNTVDWNLGNMPAKSRKFLSLQVEIAAGLPLGILLDTNAIINELITLPDSGKKGIFVNGFGLRVKEDLDSSYLKKCKSFSNERGLDWVPAYDSGSKSGDKEAVDNAVLGMATEHNGLLDNRVTGGFTYETVWAYSAGTRTVVTAIEQGKLKTKELVLISSVLMDSLEIAGLHYVHGVEKIIIYQSKYDSLGFLVGVFQFKIPQDDPLRKQPWLEVRDRDRKDYVHIQWLQKLNNEANNNNEDMHSSVSETVTPAHDPNELSVSPAGDVKPGDTLTYTIQYENEGEGTAYGVYFADTLEEDLDDPSLSIGPVLDSATNQQIGEPGVYNPETRTITWFVGEVGPHQGGSATFTVNVKADAADQSEVINYATVYFPSALESTRTNGTVNKVVIFTDDIPPTTSVSLSPEPNASGWNKEDVTVSLSATDNEGGSGVAKTEYSLDNAAWIAYTTPFTVSTEGTAMVYYQSTDNVGNVATASVAVNIDKTKPKVCISAWPRILWSPNHKMVKVKIKGKAQDSLSGIAQTTFKVEDEYNKVEPFIPGFNSTIRLEAIRRAHDHDGRRYIISVTIQDKAGNNASASTTVICPHDLRGGRNKWGHQNNYHDSHCRESD